ncbi:tRNA (adenosine(37)-N6)-dimethylallyltransferase MiaA [Candidatus Vallotia lariciata]|uniref:tRNA (adenosine(37)-N6)-dimethylallyltransferase MiaA n=1 Tax=Candidatus Vallotia laricis TaxID=2018052 RepID=UPI001D017430|nr:tRNA (adenosine(37)-N6)-dimethylallyltransferase MiaA [Candidatus Vallotia lariciata]UDG82860.1 tRNA dimethylallyltransferase [Candidatus Vallotia lariciata]
MSFAYTIACLLGPTASGKSAAALALARRAPVEIISVDSALVYRKMNIGTAKPSVAELSEVSHHLIDIIDPSDVYSSVKFCTDTIRLCSKIISRGKLPLLVGGTMLYYKMLVAGLNKLPAGNASIRSILNQYAACEGWPALHKKLSKIDPVSATQISPNDSRRIQRALEVWYLTGQTMSALLRQSSCLDVTLNVEHKAATTSTPIVPHFIAVSLEPSDRSVLHARIARRFDDMLNIGLIDEVKQLRASGDLHLGLPSMRCVGYRQVWEHLDGKYTYQTMRDKSIFATQQLCKRQLTWLRSISKRISIDCSKTDASSRTVDAVYQIWTTHSRHCDLFEGL